ncbi:hypothetical protein A2572_00415 [Candidatus Collierbacteria bacterium RIFOXYD1_FULL_40_9]|uniref:Bacterial Ig-like domain-containing protein n=1 Tax=Candidatus Collierbacteria bacterium RIFOXYD1_FULL_40_9 TaxID=1817731 RepID=A0A1F5FVB4_9BACT|nr:MAG: hypothetical protein A2572_00415 [Candidatus Collierbacteria bacterium RIFOXYD1_FULL_40_9]
MRKEVSIAIIIGVILGGIILYGIKIANDSTKNLKVESPTPTSTLTPVPITNTDKKNPAITLSSHISGQVLFEKEITLVGKTTPNSSLAIIWEDDEVITKTDVSGNFSQKITLISGENNIQVDLVNQDNSLTSETFKLYYSLKPINQ